MSKIIMFLWALMFLSTNIIAQNKYVLVIHGGAGNVAGDEMNPLQSKAYADKLNEALKAGEQILTRLVMDSSFHVILSGNGANEFARMYGLEIVDNNYFDSDKAYIEYQRIKQRLEKEGRKGTVGAVALDKHGNLASATSTGGMTYKQWGGGESHDRVFYKNPKSSWASSDIMS